MPYIFNLARSINMILFERADPHILQRFQKLFDTLLLPLSQCALQLGLIVLWTSMKMFIFKLCTSLLCCKLSAVSHSTEQITGGRRVGRIEDL